MPNDIAFKVIIKNDGISDIIFKTLMLKGEAGGTISSIEKTSSVGVVDTYTITLNDGTTTTFEVTNGSNIASIEKTASSGLIDTYTVTLTNGDTSTFEVKNGEDAQLYELPKDCVVGYDKEPTQVTETFVDRYIMLNNVNGISSVKYNGSTLQETNDGRNLFNKDDSSLILLGFLEGKFVSSITSKTICLPVEPNTTYTVSKIQSQRFRIASCPTIPTSGMSVNGMISDDTGTSITFTVGASDNFLLAFVYNSNYDTLTLDEVLDTVQIEKGSTATAYQPYCGGIPAPNPDYPREIVGVGEKQQDNTYSVDLVAEDADGNVYTVTASGLSYPVYSGDWIDLVAGVLHRSKACLDLSTINWANNASFSNVFNGTLTEDLKAGITTDILSTRYKYETSSTVTTNDFGIAVSSNRYYIYINDSNFSQASDFKTWLQNNKTLAVYSLETPTEESITLTGDLEQVKRIRGEYAYIDAPLYASTDITFGQETDFPDGYEEIDFPLDDLFYYQDQEYIEFPTSWGFVMGYVFDASEIRFTMNVTKDLHEGFNVVANKSVDLALNLYTGSGGSNLTGFNFVDASFIREYGQIQIRLKTENPHGLAVGSLLGARVSQGRLRITFEEV